MIQTNIDKLKKIQKSISFIESLSLVAGDKEAILVRAKEDLIREVINKFPALAFDSENVETELRWFSIAKKQKTARDLMDSFISRDTRKVGALLNYPECCTEFYIKHNTGTVGKNLILDIVDNSTRFSFYSNNILNYFSRLNAHRQDKSYSNFEKIISAMDLFPDLQFISHVPCSYDCERSIVIGEKNYKLLKKYDPWMAFKIIAILKNIFLFFDVFNYAILKGYMENGIVYYDKLVEPIMIGNVYLRKRLIGGDNIEIKKEEIIIKKKKTLVGIYRRKNARDGFFIDFSKNK